MSDDTRIKLYELRREMISLGSAIIQVQSVLLSMRTGQPTARIEAEMAELNRRLDTFLHELKTDSFNE